MAFRTQKISQMTPKGADLEATDLIEVSTLESGSYVTRSITGQELIDAIPAPTGFVPTSRTLTINGVTQDLSADRTYTIATGLTVGTTPIASGTIGRVLFQGTGNVLQQSANLFWDGTNNRLGIGTSTPTNDFEIAKNSATPLVIRTKNANNVSENRVSLANDLDEVANFSIFGSLNGNTALRSKVFLTATASNGFGFSLFSDSATANFSVLTTTSLTERFRIVGSTGNVLINTTTDAGFRLDVNGTARVSGNLTVATGFEFVFNNQNVGLYRSANNLRLGGFGGIEFLSSATTIASQTIRMTLFATGNLGINTTTDAGFRLDVNGTARVKTDLKIETATGGLTIEGDAGGFPTLKINTLRSGTTRRNWMFATEQFAAGDFILYRSSTGGGVANTPVYSIFNNGNIGINTTTDVASSKFTIDSTTQGFLPPRMTTTQKNAIASPAAGLMVYDTTLNVISFYNGTMWL